MFADLELARRLEGTEASAGASFVQARGGDAGWAEIGGAYAMFDGPESPLTQTFGLGMFEPATNSVLTEIEAYFRTRHSPVHHEVCPLAGVPLMQTLVKRGYRPYEVSNVVFLDLTEGMKEPVLNPGLTMRIAQDRDREAYAQAAAQGWHEARDVAHLVGELARVMFAAAGYTGFVVERDGKMVATAGLLAGASTVPEARGQGAQRAALTARLQHAAEAGCDLAMMVAEPGSASQRNAERHGFRVAYTRTKWRLEYPA
jgi:GNAT superfamily N-acetyltransferase